MTGDGIRERMVELLGATGLSQGDYAALIATTPDKLSKSLSGKRKFTATELALAAEHAGTTVDWLLRGEHPASPAIAARTAVAVPPDAGEIQTVVGRFTDAAQQIDMLDGPRPLPSAPALVESTSYVTQGNALAEAAIARVEQAGRNVVAGDLVSVVEEVFGIDVAVTSLPGDLDGCSWQSPTERFIAVERDQPWARRNFTLAHELGHILAGDAQELISEQDPSRHATLDTEKRANIFASGFLMPEPDVRWVLADGLTEKLFAALVARYRVSPQALSWRLVNLGFLDKAEQPAWGRVSAEQCLLRAGMAAALSRDVGVGQAERIPPRLARRHLELFEAGETSARPLANLLDCDTSWVIKNLREN